MLASAVGIVPVCANFEPATYIAAYRAGVARDEATLGSLQERILKVRRQLAFAGPLWIAGVKYAMSCLGLGAGLPVSPLQPLTAEQQAKVREFIEQSHSARRSLWDTK